MKPQSQDNLPWPGFRRATGMFSPDSVTSVSCHEYPIQVVPDFRSGCSWVYSLSQYSLLSGFCASRAAFAAASWLEFRLSMLGKPSLSAAISKLVEAPPQSEILPEYFLFQASSQPVASAADTWSVR